MIQDLSFEQFTKPRFYVSGKSVFVDKYRDYKIIKEFWQDFRYRELQNEVYGIENNQIYVVYHNYDHENSYQMLVGFVTREYTTQKDPNIVTIEIPEQNYMAATVPNDGPSTVIDTWEAISHKSYHDLPRLMKFDLEIYSEDMKNITMAVGVR